MSYDNSIVKDYWSKVDPSDSEKGFYCFPPIRSHSCKLIFNEFDASRRDWCEYWTVEKYLKDKIPFENALSICCGFGQIERILAKLGVAKKITGTDIAPGAIEGARKKADEENLTNIEYRVEDINKVKIAENTYDLIWANGALHHIKDLEVVIPALYKGLKPGGYLISNEYVGPNYQQIGKRQEEIINAVKHILPDNLRKKGKKYIENHSNKSLKTKFKKFIKRIINKYIARIDIYEKLYSKTSVETFLKLDPSECVNSSNIIPVLKKTFTEVDVRYYGGSILLYALDEDFFINFRQDNPAHRKLLEMLFNMEDTLIDTGEIPNDNAHIICKKY